MVKLSCTWLEKELWLSPTIHKHQRRFAELLRSNLSNRGYSYYMGISCTYLIFIAFICRKVLFIPSLPPTKSLLSTNINLCCAFTGCSDADQQRQRKDWIERTTLYWCFNWLGDRDFFVFLCSKALFNKHISSYCSNYCDFEERLSRMISYVESDVMYNVFNCLSTKLLSLISTISKLFECSCSSVRRTPL